MEHGRRLGRGVDARILAAAHRDVFGSFVGVVTSNALVEGMSRAVALFLPTSRVVPPEDPKPNPIPPVVRDESRSLAVRGRHRGNRGTRR
jgi:hypothetical protein